MLYFSLLSYYQQVFQKQHKTKDLILKRVEAENFFVTRIKENTVYETIKELDLPENEGQDVLKDEIIQLTSPKAKEIGIFKHH